MPRSLAAAEQVGGLAISVSRSSRTIPAMPIRNIKSSSRSEAALTALPVRLGGSATGVLITDRSHGAGR
jgi:hypothetical protein